METRKSPSTTTIEERPLAARETRPNPTGKTSGNGEEKQGTGKERNEKREERERRGTRNERNERDKEREGKKEKRK
jgi:hypothetical protein